MPKNPEEQFYEAVDAIVEARLRERISSAIHKGPDVDVSLLRLCTILQVKEEFREIAATKLEENYCA